MGTRVNPDTIGCVWTGEFDLNTLRVDGEIFESGKKTLRIQKYPDTCGRGLSDLKLCQRDYVTVLKMPSVNYVEHLTIVMTIMAEIQANVFLRPSHAKRFV